MKIKAQPKLNSHNKNKECDCGNPATVITNQAAICTRCHTIEQRNRSYIRNSSYIPIGCTYDTETASPASIEFYEYNYKFCRQ
jgi:hypothetical protein